MVFDEDGDGEDIAEDYDAVEVDTVPKQAYLNKQNFLKQAKL